MAPSKAKNPLAPGLTSAEKSARTRAAKKAVQEREEREVGARQLRECIYLYYVHCTGCIHQHQEMLNLMLELVCICNMSLVYYILTCFSCVAWASIVPRTRKRPSSPLQSEMPKVPRQTEGPNSASASRTKSSAAAKQPETKPTGMSFAFNSSTFRYSSLEKVLIVATFFHLRLVTARIFLYQQILLGMTVHYLYSVLHALILS